MLSVIITIENLRNWIIVLFICRVGELCDCFIIARSAIFLLRVPLQIIRLLLKMVKLIILLSPHDLLIHAVHCRKHHSELGHPSTSANIYWQFEKKSDGRSGMPIFWEEPCRIKHLPTRCYLVVTYDQVKGSYNVSLIHV